jgi:hypothetical protein
VIKAIPSGKTDVMATRALATRICLNDTAQCLVVATGRGNVMKASIVLASLAISVATAPAFAAGMQPDADEGLPPNVGQQWKSVGSSMKQGSAERYIPQYLHAQGGEITLTRNPEFVVPPVERTPADIIRTQSIPATTYVGA